MIKKRLYFILFLFMSLISFFSCNKNETTNDNISEPRISALEVSNISPTSVMLSASIIDNGGSPVIKRGFRLSKNSSIKANDNWEIDNDCSSGTDNFSCTISGLEENTTYYYIAYASTRKGVVYTDIASFTTSKGVGIPLVELTPVVSSINYSANGYKNDNGNIYKYKMTYKVGLVVRDYTKVSRVGYKIESQSWYWDNPTGNDIYSNTMTTMANTPTIRVVLIPFAIMKDGTEYTGNTKTVSATYNGDSDDGSEDNTVKSKKADYTSARTSYSGGHSVFVTYESMASHLNCYGLLIYKNGKSYYWTDYRNVRHAASPNRSYSNLIYDSNIQMGNSSNHYQVRTAYLYVSFRFSPF